MINHYLWKGRQIVVVGLQFEGRLFLCQPVLLITVQSRHLILDYSSCNALNSCSRVDVARVRRVSAL